MKFYDKNRTFRKAIWGKADLHRFKYTIGKKSFLCFGWTFRFGENNLLNAIGRLEKPTEGKIYFEGKDIWKMKESKYFGQYLGYVFQNYALMDEATVYENLKIIDNRLNIIEALKKVGLDESYLKMKIYELSGGQAQRVAIARVLLKKAQIILADEPTGALDEVTGQSIIQLLLELVSPNTIVIFATHDPRVFEKVDHVIDVSKL